VMVVKTKRKKATPKPLSVRKTGRGRVVISGATYKYRERIRGAGFKWDPNLKEWWLEPRTSAGQGNAYNWARELQDEHNKAHGIDPSGGNFKNVFLDPEPTLPEPEPDPMSIRARAASRCRNCGGPEGRTLRQDPSGLAGLTCVACSTLESSELDFGD
jgi:hypothetical protein